MRLFYASLIYWDEFLFMRLNFFVLCVCQTHKTRRIKLSKNSSSQLMRPYLYCRRVDEVFVWTKSSSQYKYGYSSLSFIEETSDLRLRILGQRSEFGNWSVIADQSPGLSGIFGFFAFLHFDNDKNTFKVG